MAITKTTGKALVAKKVWYFIQSVTAELGSPGCILYRVHGLKFRFRPQFHR